MGREADAINKLEGEISADKANTKDAADIAAENSVLGGTANQSSGSAATDDAGASNQSTGAQA